MLLAQYIELADKAFSDMLSENPGEDPEAYS